MSLSYQKLDPVLVRDPRTIITNKRDYAVLRSGSQTTFKVFTTTSVSNSSIQFSCPPPSSAIIIDRKQYFTLPIRLAITGVVGPSGYLLNPQYDAPRAFPIASSVDTLQVTINNQGVSINIADMVQALMHFNTPCELQELDYSLTPSALDQSQVYSQLLNSIRSPLNNTAASNDKSVAPRGSFPFTIIGNTLQTVGATTTVYVDMVCTEPLFLSPFYWGRHDSSGFVNVTTMDFNITFLNQSGNRMWSHDASSGSTITNIAASFNNFTGAGGVFSYYLTQPTMLFTYITPNETQIIPWNVPVTYPYFDVQRYPTDSSNSFAAVGTMGDAQIINSNNIQLNSIPRRLYIYARQSNSVLYSSPNYTDTYLSIESISIQWGNKNGLLASASKQQLYNISVKNHCNMSWPQWSGEGINNDQSNANFGVPASQIGLCGAILCLEMATDIGLESLEAPGKLGQYQLQVRCNFKNISSAALASVTMYIIVVSEGSFTIEGLAKASTNIGVISSQDILDAQSSRGVNYNDIQEVNGGNFLSGLKDFGKDVNSFLRDSKVISNVLSSIPHPASQGISKVAESLGYGESEGGCDMGGVYAAGHRKKKGGVIVGGKHMSRKQMMMRAMK